MFDVAHGAGLAAVYGSWARYVYKTKPDRFAKFAEKVFGIAIENGDVEKAALAGIEAMEEFYRSINMPTSIHELGIDLTDEQIEELAEKCCFFAKWDILFVFYSICSIANTNEHHPAFQTTFINIHP